MNQAELQIAQEKTDYLIQLRLESILEAWLIQGGILFAFCGILLAIFGLRKSSMIFFALYAFSILSLPSAFNMLLGALLLVAIVGSLFLRRQPISAPTDS